MRRWTRWQDWLNLLLGVWLFAAPWVLRYAYGVGYVGNTQAVASGTYHTAGAAAWSNWASGVLIVAFAIWAVTFPWAELLNMAMGVWVFISPWVLGFMNMPRAAVDDWVVGALVFLLAGYALLMVRRTRVGERTPDPRYHKRRDRTPLET